MARICRFSDLWWQLGGFWVLAACGLGGSWCGGWEARFGAFAAGGGGWNVRFTAVFCGGGFSIIFGTGDLWRVHGGLASQRRQLGASVSTSDFRVWVFLGFHVGLIRLCLGF